MCGRFAQYRPDKIRDVFDIDVDDAGDLPFNYNVAPTQKVIAVVKDRTRKAIAVKWQLETDWSRGKNYSLINIRDDNLLGKDTFEENFRKFRCIIPADGFYEWRKDGGKVPYYIHYKNSDLMAMAGLLNFFDGSVTAAIVTTRANSLLGIIHDKKRMPVILPEDRWDEWLDNTKFDRGKLASYLEPVPEGVLEAYVVSSEVNSPKFNKPEYIIRTGELLG